MERKRLDGAVTAPMSMPPGWQAQQSKPYRTARHLMPGHFYAVAPYLAYRVGKDLQQTVTAESPGELAKLAWEQHHKHTAAVSC